MDGKHSSRPPKQHSVQLIVSLMESLQVAVFLKCDDTDHVTGNRMAACCVPTCTKLVQCVKSCRVDALSIGCHRIHALGRCYKPRRVFSCFLVLVTSSSEVQC